jgi:hypothetical protein
MVTAIALFAEQEDLTHLPEDDYEEKFDFGKPESVIFLIDGIGPYRVCDVCILDDPNDDDPHVMGAMSYEQSYGGFLDYTVEEMLPRDLPFGVYVMEGIAGEYHRGDWSWGEDDDMSFYPGTLRPARYREVRDYLGGKSRLMDFWDCLRTHLLFLWGGYHEHT